MRTLFNQSLLLTLYVRTRSNNLIPWNSVLVFTGALKSHGPALSPHLRWFTRDILICTFRNIVHQTNINCGFSRGFVRLEKFAWAGGTARRMQITPSSAEFAKVYTNFSVGSPYIPRLMSNKAETFHPIPSKWTHSNSWSEHILIQEFLYFT